MKLACSSSAFDELLASGELTQLEWIDLCAHELAVDGVVVDVRHFPRADTDYLAQVKKMAADLGLILSALYDEQFFSQEAAHMDASLGRALALGAPLVSCPLPAETTMSWSEVQARLGHATASAKRLNVTLAARNAPHTFAASTYDMKRVSKEADSAWLRYGAQFDALEAGSRPQELLAKVVLVWQEIAVGPENAPALASLLNGYRGFVALDARAGDASPQQMKNVLHAWRRTLFEQAVADRT